MSTAVKEGGKQMVRLLEKFPEERMKHMVSFKQTQLNRFKRVAGLQIDTNNNLNGENDPKLSINEIKDMLNRSKGPLGLQRDDLKKIQAVIPRDQFTEQDLKKQLESLKNLMSNKYQNYYDVGDKMYKPAGNPQYYSRLMDEINGQKKETFFSAMKVIFFGK